MSSENENNKDKVLYFDIHGMHCQSCPLLIETTLQYEKCIKEITINLVTGRARIVSDQNTDAHTVAQLIKNVNPDKFSATLPQYLPPQIKDLNAITAWMCFANFLNQLSLSKIESDYAYLLS